MLTRGMVVRGAGTDTRVWRYGGVGCRAWLLAVATRLRASGMIAMQEPGWYNVNETHRASPDEQQVRRDIDQPRETHPNMR